MLVTELIANDHRTVQQLFNEVEDARPAAAPKALDRLIQELNVHAAAEEAVFYPAAREVSRRIDDAEAGHDHMRRLIDAVQSMEPGTAEFTQAFMQLKSIVLNHAMEEEAGVLRDAERLGLEKIEELGAAMAESKAALEAERPNAERAA